MLLHSLHLQNFKRFAEERVVFRDGITGIVGNNGAGKSSLVEAILFALYGVQSSGVDPDHIVSAAAGDGARATVRLDFGAGGADYTVVRYFRRSGSSTQHEARLFAGSRQIAEGVTDVQHAIRRIVGMGPTDFRNTIYAGQKDLLSLLESRSGERRRWFMQALRIDAIRDAADEDLKALLDEQKERHTELSGRLKELDAESLQQELAAARRQEAALRERLKGMDERQTAVAAAIRERESKVDALRGKEREHISLQQGIIARREALQRVADECERLEAEISARRMLEGEYRSLAAQENRYRELVREVEREEERKALHDRLQGERRQHRDRLEIARQRIQALEALLERCARDACRLQELQEPLARLEELRGRLEELRTKESEYTRLRGECGRVRERLRGIEERMQRISAELASLRERGAELDRREREIARLDGLLQEESILAAAKIPAEQAAFWESQRDAAERHLSRMEEELHRLAARLTELDGIDGRIAATEEARDAAAHRRSSAATRYSGAVEEREALEQRLREIEHAGADGACPTCHRPLRDHFGRLVDELRQEVREAQQRIGALDAEYREAAADLERATADLRHLAERRNALQGLRERAAACESERRSLQEQRQRAEEGRARALDALRELGLESYDPGRHDALQSEIVVLRRRKEEADTLRGECLRMEPLGEELAALGLEGEGCIAEEELISARIRELGFQPQERRDVEEEIAALMQPWQEHLQIRERLKNGDAARAELDELREAAREAEANLAAAERELQTLAFDPAGYAALLAEYRRAVDSHRRFAELAVRMDEIPDLEKSLSERKAYRQQVESEVAWAERSLARLGFDPARLAAAEDSLRQCTERAQWLAAERTRTEGDLRHLEGEISRISLALERSAEYAAECDAIREEMERLRLTRKCLGDFVTHLLSAVRGRIEGEAGRILAQITDGRYESVILDEKFNLLVHDMGDDYPVNRFSGGEQDDIAIALRIALSRYLAEVHQVHDSTFLIFDEIFGSQDEGRRSNLIQALRSQEANFPQILIISHVSEVQGEFSNTLLVEMGEDQTSRVQEISP
ncbi:MAG: SMC family ATPase [Methanomicrobiales archaeon]|nr:SMC family ATPase [Methanomicrobiales archaeon]